MQIYLQLLRKGVVIFIDIAYIDYEAKGKGTAKPCPNAIRAEWKKREAKRARHEKGRQSRCPNTIRTKWKKKEANAQEATDGEDAGVISRRSGVGRRGRR